MPDAEPMTSSPSPRLANDVPLTSKPVVSDVDVAETANSSLYEHQEARGNM